MADALPICTIGHSTRTIEEFVELLRVGEVATLVDVRSIPRSRTNPQYNLDRLPEELAAYQLRHRYIAELGGLRKKTPEVEPETNGLWRNKSFHNYADYALTEPFRAGLDELLALAERERCAIMCSEAVWWRCHRPDGTDRLTGVERLQFSDQVWEVGMIVCHPSAAPVHTSNEPAALRTSVAEATFDWFW